MRRFHDLLIGPALPTTAASREKLSIPLGLAVLSSDVLSSCAYATDQLLGVLVLGSAAALFWSLPICAIIIALLAVLVISYRQLIRAYPLGGGSYTVATENLGKGTGLVAASGLLIDYVLTVSVSIAAGVDAVISAFPALIPVRVEIGLVFLLILVMGNLRGVRESGRAFAFPTLFFVVTLMGLLVAGVLEHIFGHTAAAATPMVPVNITGSVSLFLLLRAFSSGCTALTGTEAISNGVLVFKKPEVENARKTMLFMGIILGTLFLGMTFLARTFGILPTTEQTVISQIAHVVFGNGPFYYIVQFATLLILIFAANTSFADFPRVASMLGRDGYLPNQLSDVGSRLVYSNGIIVLGVLGGVLLVAFRADVSALIPLYAVGVFISFTLAQAGMVRHWYHAKGPGWLRSAVINGAGALFTGLALIVIAATKFTHGAWFVLVLIPLSVYVFSRIHRHYENLATKLSLEGQKSTSLSPISRKHKVIVLVPRDLNGIPWAVKYARTLSKDVHCVYVNKEGADKLDEMRSSWSAIARDIALTTLPCSNQDSPASFVTYLRGIKDYDSSLTIVLPENAVTGNWWHRFRQNQQKARLKSALLKKHIPVVSVISDGTAEADLLQADNKNSNLLQPVKHTVVVPISGVRKGIVQAIQYAKTISPDIKVVYVDCEGSKKAQEMQKQWSVYLPSVPLLTLTSPYRELIGPVKEYIQDLRHTPNNLVTVIIPELVTETWWSRFLHRNMAGKLKTALLYQEHIPVLSFSYGVRKRPIRVVSPYRALNQ